jgi:hypothetical protein
MRLKLAFIRGKDRFMSADLNFMLILGFYALIVRIMLTNEVLKVAKRDK